MFLMFDVLKTCLEGTQTSNSQLRRLLSQNAIKVDGETISDANQVISISNDARAV